MPAVNRGKRQQHDADQLLNKISNFVESIWLNGDGKQGVQNSRSRERQNEMMCKRQASSSPRDRTDKRRKKPSTSATPSSADRANKRADKVILNAEHFKASINAPTGKDIPPKGYDNLIDNQAGSVRANQDINLIPTNYADNDDDFFHVTCHIESALREIY